MRKLKRKSAEISEFLSRTGKLELSPLFLCTLNGNNAMRRSVDICRDVGIKIFNKQRLVDRNDETKLMSHEDEKAHTRRPEVIGTISIYSACLW